MNNIISNFEKVKYGPAPEDDREVMKWIKNLPKPNQNFINGEWSKSKTKIHTQFQWVRLAKYLRY